MGVNGWHMQRIIIKFSSHRSVENAKIYCRLFLVISSGTLSRLKVFE